MKYAVKYTPLDFLRTEFSHTSLLFYKPSCYRIEREYRLLRPPGEDESFELENPADFVRRIPIKTEKRSPSSHHASQRNEGNEVSR
jgi:hypothetical protein